MDAPGGRQSFQDKTGALFELGPCRPGEDKCLQDMYEVFTPKKVGQGLPPEDSAVCRTWVESLLGRAENFLVWDGDQVVGHSAFIPDHDRRDAEYIIFVLDPFRSRGLGSRLTAAAVEKARRLGLTRLWLTVEAHNFRAIRLYRKYGFVFRDQGGWERIMMLEL
ncbi:MAG: GNAT family N-acetyltransferase [Thermodesulfobacteriota bacterium]